MNKPIISKRDVGAQLLWTWINTLQRRFEQLEESYLRVSRANMEMKRRLDVVQETTVLHGRIVFEKEPTVKMSCISCDHTFNLPLPEAQVMNFTSVCATCGSWALPLREGREYSPHEIAEITGFAHSTVCRVIRDMELKPRYKQRLFNEKEFKKIDAVLQEKIRKGGGNGKGNRKTDK